MDVHGRFVVRAQEAHAFFCDLGELEEGDHLEAVEGGVISACCFFFFVVIDGNNVPSTVYSHVSPVQFVHDNQPLKYLSRYCAATTAAYARRPRHRASFVQASVPFTRRSQSFSMSSIIFPSSLRLRFGGSAYKWYVLFKHSLHPVSSSCFGVKPLSEACVATGMKMGSGTGPCGRCSVAARARVVC